MYKKIHSSVTKKDVVMTVDNTVQREQNVKKTYVLDTNVLLSDPGSINSFKEHDVIIPMIVLEELDRHKSRPDDVGKNARHVSRALDDMRQTGSLLKGMPLPEGGVLRVAVIQPDAMIAMPLELSDRKVDNMIIAFMLSLVSESKSSGITPILVSQDINVRLKCDSLGIACEDYRKMRIAADSDSFYRGVSVIELPDQLVEMFYNNGDLDLAAHPEVTNGRKFYPNEIIVIKSLKNGITIRSAITKCVSTTGSLIPVLKIDSAYGLKPRNKEQTFSLDLLFDENVKLLTLVGPAGTGKTLLALAAAMEQLKGMGSPAYAKYDKLIVTRPVQPVGKDIGFLPGTMEEKMEPWISPIRDNLNFLVGGKKNKARKSESGEGRNHGRGPSPKGDNAYLALMQERGLIEVEAITFIRGRSIPNAFIVIDEAQNLTMHELKTIITRVGEGTKIVLTGDIEQIDNVHVDVFTNGLTYAVEKFKTHPIAGHITLVKGERSALATLASQIL